jgi:hypothetical protein
MQQPRDDVAVQYPSCERYRWLGQDEEKSSNQEERHIFKIVQLNSPDTIHIFIWCQLFSAWTWVEDRLLDVFRRAKPSLTCIILTTVNHDIITALRIICRPRPRRC